MKAEVDQLLRRAAAIILDKQAAAVHEKEGHFNFVTDADLAVQEVLREGLLAILPGSRLYAEEQENAALSDEATWIVDPIDGTVNYMRGRRFSAISVALIVEREAVMAWIFDPFAEEMFYAGRGEGCTLNGEPAQVSAIPFERALVTFGTSPYQPELARQGMRAAYAVLQEAGDLRRTGTSSLDLAWVACGRTEVFFEMMLYPWDYAAGVLLVREAGGQVAQPLAAAFDHSLSTCILAANPQCFDRPLQILREAASGGLETL
ncbi:MAG: inositol monophosphatase [Christensenellales bacterium]